MFWVTDNFLMKKPRRSSRKRAVRYQRVRPANGTTNNNEDDNLGDSDTLLSGDEDLLVDGEGSIPAGATSPLAYKNVEDLLLNVNRRNNSVV